MHEFVELVEEVLAERRWSARQVSIEALGTPNAISSLRSGQMPSIHRVRAICDVLGLEFYIGRPRTVGGAQFDVSRLAIAIQALAESFPDAGRRLTVHDQAQLLVALYALIDSGDPAASAGRVRELLAIARRFGVTDAVQE